MTHDPIRTVTSDDHDDRRSAQPDPLQTLAAWISDCPAGGMVFLGGAGVSTESGIPDFRSAGGVYERGEGYPYPYAPETMCSRWLFDRDPQAFFAFYFERMVALDVRPNRAHRALTALERSGTLAAVATQNIDGLHQAAGSERVLELHGSVHRNHCMRCGRAFDARETLALHGQAPDGVPRCPSCGAIVKPDVVLYQENLDEEVLGAAVHAISRAKLLLVAGTSLAVWPAAGLVDYFSGDHLVICNLTPTPATPVPTWWCRARWARCSAWRPVWRERAWSVWPTRTALVRF